MMNHLNRVVVLPVGEELNEDFQGPGGTWIKLVPLFRLGDTGEEGPMRRYEDDEPLVVPKEWPEPVPEQEPAPVQPVKEPVRTPA